VRSPTCLWQYARYPVGWRTVMDAATQLTTRPATFAASGRAPPARWNARKVHGHVKAVTRHGQSLSQRLPSYDAIGMISASRRTTPSVTASLAFVTVPSQTQQRPAKHERTQNHDLSRSSIGHERRRFPR